MPKCEYEHCKNEVYSESEYFCWQHSAYNKNRVMQVVTHVQRLKETFRFKLFAFLTFVSLAFGEKHGLPVAGFFYRRLVDLLHNAQGVDSRVEARIGELEYEIMKIAAIREKLTDEQRFVLCNLHRERDSLIGRRLGPNLTFEQHQRQEEMAEEGFEKA